MSHHVVSTAIDLLLVQTCLYTDDPSLRELIVFLLAKIHIKVTVCPLGWLAYHCISHTHPKVILLDVEVPYVDGIQLFHALRSKGYTMDIPVIFFTTHPDQVREALPNYEEMGAALLSKPFDPQELLDLVQAKAAS